MLSQARLTSALSAQCRVILSKRQITHTRLRMMSSVESPLPSESNTPPIPTSPSEHSPPSGPPPVRTSSKQPPLPSESKFAPLRTAYVRTWEPPKNIADAYIILRTLERKYGKILEARFLKDYEDPIRYQMMFWVIFEDPQSVQRIPLDGSEFLYTPSSLAKERHEITMADIEHLSRSVDYTEGSEKEGKDAKGNDVATENQDAPENFQTGGRIIRADHDVAPAGVLHSNDRNIYQKTPKYEMAAFLQWGGFQPLEPLSNEPIIDSRELFGNSDLDNVRMRAALQMASKNLGVDNPSIRPAEVKGRTSEKGSLSSLVFGDDAAFQRASSPKANPAASILGTANPKAKSQLPGGLPPPPPKPKKEKQAATKQTAKPVPEESSPPPPKEKDAATIAAEKKTQELLKTQLLFAQTLRAQNKPSQRKQPKPQLKMVREKPALFEGKPAAPVVEDRKPGVLDRLWSVFGRK